LATQTPTADCLLIGPNPQRAALAGFCHAAGFRIGGINPLKMNDAMTRWQFQ
jgi:hypothetical protein